MSDDISPKTSVRLPAGAVAGILASLISIGATYGTFMAKAETQADAIARLEQRVADLEKANGRVLELLGRIDERTAITSKQLDAISAAKGVK